MPVIAVLYGMYISMYYFDSKKHHIPHIHVNFAELEAVFSILDANCLEGSIPSAKKRLLKKWILLNKDALMINWENAIQGKPVSKIKSLK